MDEIPELARSDAGAHEKEESSKAALSISEAARACGMARATIRQHRQAGDFPGAYRDQQGVWRIPREDLEWAGLKTDADEFPGESTEGASRGPKIDKLRTEVAVLRERLRAAELVAAEREQRIGDLRLVLRLIPTSLMSESSSPQLPPQAAPSFPSGSIEGRTEPLSSQAGSIEQSRSIATADRSSDREAESEERGLLRTRTVEAEPIIRLPDIPEGRSSGLERVDSTTASQPISIWAPEGSSSREEKPPIHQPARFFGPPLNVRGHRNRWLPWRRSHR